MADDTPKAPNEQEEDATHQKSCTDQDSPTGTSTSATVAPPTNTPAPSQTRRSTTTGRRHPKYRGGFSTSICGFFDDPTRRTDCCALVCCGILSSDRNRYLLTNELPPPLWKRVCINLCLPPVVFLVVVMIMIMVMDNSVSVSVILFAFVLIILGMQMRAFLIRKRFREDLLWKLHLERHGGEGGVAEESSADAARRASLIQMHSSDTVCAHLACGLYKHDKLCVPEEDDDMWEEDELLLLQKQAENADICSRMWRLASSLCCCCGMWIQCFGICAIGQEEREMNRLIPKSERLFDYMTFQPYAEYYTKIETLRTNGNGNFIAHVKSLSQLSTKLVKGLGSIIALLLLGAIIEIDSSFTILNMLVLLATFLQAFFVLYLVHWKWNKFHISLDAVVKYFCSGFVFSIGFAFVFEWLVSIGVGMLTIVLYTLALPAELDAVDDAAASASAASSSSNPEQGTKDAMEHLFEDNVWIAAIIAFVNAFIAAAFVEELCKYFGFWMVEHPDFMSAEEYDMVFHPSAAVPSTAPSDQVNTTEQQDVLSDENKCCWEEQDETPTNNPPTEQPNHPPADSANNNNNNTPHHHQNRTHSNNSIDSTGKGITIAMVSTALGFACCENLTYVFLSNSAAAKQVWSEFCILLVRSLFPIHPLAAAIQSIGVCRRDLEFDRENEGRNNSSYKLGRIIFPAVILHGSYDFAMMFYEVIVSKQQSDYDDDQFPTNVGGGDMEAAEENACALFQSDPFISLTGMLFVVIGAAYYIAESRAQKARFQAQQVVKQSHEGGCLSLTPIV